MPTDVAGKLEALVKRYKNLAGKMKALEDNDGYLQEQNTALLNEVEALKAAIPRPKHWQAVLVNADVNISAVHGSGDANKDGFTSIEEAVKHAQQRIDEGGFGHAYRAGVVATW